MPLDFEVLRKETIDPGANVGKTLEQRLATLERLTELDITDQVIAQTCAVDPHTVRSWRSQHKAPVSDVGRRALDRLGPVIEHMEDDLGLGDKAIADFLGKEPRTKESLDDSWDPSWDAFFRTPVMTQISAHVGPMDGLETIKEHLEARFPERQVYAQAGIDATPETVV